MPFVNVKVIEGVFSAAQKQDMVRQLTDTMVGIEGENMRQVTWVVVEEVEERRLGHRRQSAEHRGREGAGRRAARRLARTSPSPSGARCMT